MNKNQFVRICLEILGGIVLSVAVCAVLIFLGYYHIKSAQLNKYVVNFISIPIYEISRSGDQLTGLAINQNMSIIGIAFSMILIIATEVTVYFKKKSK